MDASEIAIAVRQELNRRGLSPYRAARLAGLPDNTFRYVLEGRDSRLSKLLDVCDALELECYIGPSRPEPDSVETAIPPQVEAGAQSLVRAVTDAGGNPIPDDLWPELARRRGGAMKAVPIGQGFDLIRRYTDDVRLAAGDGSPGEGETVGAHVAFRSAWLRSRGWRAGELSLIDVIGNSMAPTLENGDTVMVHHGRRAPRDGAIFALRGPGGPTVKRLRKREGWWADSDNEQHRPRALSEDDEIVGQVVWATRSLPI